MRPLPYLVQNALRVESILARTSRVRALAWDGGVTPRPSTNATDCSSVIHSLVSAGQSVEAVTLLRTAHAASLSIDRSASAAAVAAAASSAALTPALSEVARLASLSSDVFFSHREFERLARAHLDANDIRAALYCARELGCVGADAATAAIFRSVASTALEIGALRLAVRGMAPAAVDVFVGSEPATSAYLDELVSSGAQGDALVAQPFWDGLCNLALKSVDPLEADAAARLWSAILDVQAAVVARCLFRVSVDSKAPMPRSDAASFAASALSTPLADDVYSTVLRIAVVRGDADTCASVLAQYSTAYSDADSSLRLVFGSESQPAPLSPALVYLIIRTFSMHGRWRDVIDTLRLHIRSNRNSAAGAGAATEQRVFASADRVADRVKFTQRLSETMEGHKEPILPPLWTICWPNGGGPAALKPSKVSSAMTNEGARVISEMGESQLSSDEIVVFANADISVGLVDIVLRALSAAGQHAMVRSLWHAGLGARLLDELRDAKSATSTMLKASASLSTLFPVGSSALGAVDEDEAAQCLDSRTPSTQRLVPWSASSLPLVINSLSTTGDHVSASNLILSALDIGLPFRCRSNFLRAAAAWVAEASALDGDAPSQRELVVERLIAEASSAGAINAALGVDVSLELARAVVGVHAPDEWAPTPESRYLSPTASESLDLDFSISFHRNVPEKLAHSLALMRAQSIELPADAPLRLALRAILVDDATLASTKDISAVVSDWLQARSVSAAVAQLSSALSVYTCIDKEAAAAGRISEGPSFSVELARAYSIFFGLLLSLSDRVALSFGSSGSGAPLSALEMSLRSATLTVLDIAVDRGHMKELLALDGRLASTLLQGLLSPLIRRVGSAESTPLALPLLRGAARTLALFSKAAVDAPSLIVPWTPAHYELFYTAATKMQPRLLSSERSGVAPAADVVAGAVRDLLDLRRSLPAPLAENVLHPLVVGSPKLWSLVTLVARSGAAHTLARVLSCIIFSRSATPSNAMSPTIAQCFTDSAIVLQSDVIASAVLASSRLGMRDAVRVHFTSAGVISDVTARWLRASSSSPICLTTNAAATLWLSLLTNSQSASADALCYTPLPVPRLTSSGHVLRILPSAGPATIAASAHPGDSAAALGGSVTASGDAFVVISSDEGAADLPAAVVADLLTTAASDSRLAPAIPRLMRELLRLGVWLSPAAIRVLAAETLRDRALLVPLLMHLQAQAVALVRAVPDLAPLAPALLSAIPPTGTGVDSDSLELLVDAATASGMLHVALQLLQTAPQGWRLSPSSAQRLTLLAARSGEAAVVDHIRKTFLGAQGVHLGSRPFLAAALGRARAAHWQTQGQSSLPLSAAASGKLQRSPAAPLGGEGGDDVDGAIAHARSLFLRSRIMDERVQRSLV